MFSYDAKVRVRYKETDRMGIVHHSNYYVWFEVGRTEYMRALGMGYREMEEQGLMFPVLETSCNYKVGAKYDDEIIITTRLSEFKGVRITFEYDVIRNVDNVLLAQGKTVHCFVDNYMKPINIRKANRKVYDILTQSLKKE